MINILLKRTWNTKKNGNLEFVEKVARKLFNKIFINAVSSDSFKFIHSLYTPEMSFPFKRKSSLPKRLKPKEGEKKVY